MDTVKIIQFDAEKCTGCLECEKACSNVLFGTPEGGDKSAIRIIRKDDGFEMENSGNGKTIGRYEMTNCNQCGLCIDLCPTMALKRAPNGTVILNKNACVECQSCVAFCPDGVMRRAPGTLIPHKCISCGKCVEACPENALSLVEVKISEVERVVYHQQGVCE